MLLVELPGRMNIRSSVWMSPGMRYYLGAIVVRGFLLVYLFFPSGLVLDVNLCTDAR